MNKVDNITKRQKNKKISEFLTREEMSELLKPSDLKGLQALTVNWGIIVAVFGALFYFQFHPISILLGIVMKTSALQFLAIIATI